VKECGMPQTPETSSILQPGLSVTGHLTSTGDIIVGGRIEGEITGNTVEVLEGASIRGKLKADIAIINGVVTGHVHVGTASIGTGGALDGELQYGIVEIAQGAKIETQFVPVSGAREKPRETSGPSEPRETFDKSA
jgi:cytoskeletal protein CcmA (bactofilin family)